MARDIEIYFDSVCCGFRQIYDIEAHFDEYFEKAHAMSEFIDWDEIILFAVYSFNPETETLVSADFMTLRMDYCRYAELCSKLSKNCRLFFVKNGQGGYYY